jgi:5-methylthioadenosine/S-adenosylhomocysteine deaminase
VASNNLCDLIEESRFAAFAARNLARSNRFLSSATVLEAATLGGAKALGMENVIGSLETGKAADMAVISLDHPSQQPVGEINSAIVFASSGRDCLMTIVSGNVVYKKR